MILDLPETKWREMTLEIMSLRKNSYMVLDRNSDLSRDSSREDSHNFVPSSEGFRTQKFLEETDPRESSPDQIVEQSDRTLRRYSVPTAATVHLLAVLS